MEHLENDLGALRNILDALEENGRAIVLVPCGPKLYGTLDTVLGHFRRYTKPQFTELAARAGFHLEELLSFNRFGSPAWWLNGRLLRRKTFGLWQIKMLNVLTPMVRVIDRFLPLPPLSIIAILRKPPVGPAKENMEAGPGRESALQGAVR